MDKITMEKEESVKRTILGYDDLKLEAEKELVKRELAVLGEEFITDCNNIKRVSKPSYRKSSNAATEKSLLNSYKMQIKDMKAAVSCQVVTIENQLEMVTKAVTLFHDLPYKEQLRMKKLKNHEVVQRLKANKKVSSGVSCSASNTIPSPVLEKYRTKDQFSVMTDIQGKVTVGFFVGNKREGVVCVEPSTINIIRDSHKEVAREYQELLRKSELPVRRYQGETGEGYWGDIMVRSNCEGEIMVKIEFHRNNLDEDRMEDIMVTVKETFEVSELPIVSLYLAVKKKKNIVRNRLVMGKKALTEVIRGVPMLLGPDTFCQGNIPGTEVLLDLVRSKVGSSKSKTLLDICCGAGLYSLHLSDRFRGCTGVDITDMSIATKNAEINALENCNFVRGRVEAKIPKMVEDIKMPGAGVSAILNPGRAGVHNSVITELRQIPLLDTLVYVSCEPEDRQVCHNMIGLLCQDRTGTPHNLLTKPFRLEEAIPVDLFPHTHHCEHVLVFR